MTTTSNQEPLQVAKDALQRIALNICGDTAAQVIAGEAMDAITALQASATNNESLGGEEAKILAGQVRAWTKERDRLNDMLAAASQQAGSAVAKDTPESMADSNARHAIDGAIQFGRENRNPPPSVGHWLYEYWNIGRQLAKLGETGWDNVTPMADTGAAGASEPYVLTIHKFGRTGSGVHKYRMSDGSIATMSEQDALTSAAKYANSMAAKDALIADLLAQLARHRQGSGEPVAASDDASWTILHNGKSVSADTLSGCMAAARQLRTPEETAKAAENLAAAIAADMAEEQAERAVAAQVDWLGLALDLEKQAKRIESQTVERAMTAAAHGLRLMGAARSGKCLGWFLECTNGRGEKIFAPVHPAMPHAVQLYTTPAPQAQGEPVAWVSVHDKTDLYYRKPAQVDVAPLYLGPAAQADEVRDAARYRWLRHMVWDSTCFHNEGRMKIGAELDAAIDDALRTTAADNQKGPRDA